MNFHFETDEDDFFGALKPLIPRAIEIGHFCYEQVLIKDGIIAEGEYDKEIGKDGLFVSDMEFSDERMGFSMHGRAFASTPQIHELAQAINSIQNMLSELGLYHASPFPDESLSTKITIDTMYFRPGSFTIRIHVKRYRDSKYHGYLNVIYEVPAYNIDEVKSHLDVSATIRNQTYEELFQAIQQAKTNDEKKKSLENFASLLFSDIGLEVKYMDKQGLDSEIDSFIINESQDVFLRELGNPILVECKNTADPMPASAIRDFGSKLRDKGNIKTGIIISMKGVTGNQYTDAKGAIRTFLTRDKIKLITFDGSDLEKVTKGESFKDILREKYYEILTY